MVQKSIPAKSKAQKPARKPVERRQTWEVAYLFPEQGEWTKADFLALDSIHNGFPLIELSDGRLDVLPMPTEIHQLIGLLFLELLKDFVVRHAPGVVLYNGMRLRLKNGKKARFRDPDVMYMKAENAHRRHNEYWDGADLVMEVVSKGSEDQERDLVTKPREYAQAQIPEYWIINPYERYVRVLTLDGSTYKLHGEFGPGKTATSVLLPGFAVSVDTLLTPPGSQA